MRARLEPRPDASVGPIKGDQLLRVAHGKVAQHNLMHQREDRRVAADAERQREQRHNGEPRTLSQAANAQPQVLQHAVDGGFPTR